MQLTQTHPCTGKQITISILREGDMYRAMIQNAILFTVWRNWPAP